MTDRAVLECGSGVGVAIVRSFLRTEFEGGRHARRVGQISEIERATLVAPG